MEPAYISNCLQYIMDDNSAVSQYPLGVLTTENRDVWAEAREHLESLGNREVRSLLHFLFLQVIVWLMSRTLARS